MSKAVIIALSVIIGFLLSDTFTRPSYKPPPNPGYPATYNSHQYSHSKAIPGDLIRLPVDSSRSYTGPFVSATPVNRDANRELVKRIYEDSEPNYYSYYSNLERKQSFNGDESKFKSGLGSSNYYKASDNNNYDRMTKSFTSNSFELKRFGIKSYITDTAITSIYSQLYFHNGHEQEEGRYELPLPPQSVVSNFTVVYGGVRLQGEVKEKLEARKEYKETIKKGGQAFLAEKDSRGYFVMKLGNIPAKIEVTIEITIVSEIGTHLEAFHYLLHRYNFPSGGGLYEFDLNIQIQQSSRIKSITMNGYPGVEIVYGSSGRTATVNYYSESVHITKNVLVVITPEQSEKPQSIIEFNPETNTYAAAINFYPKWNNDEEEEIKTFNSEIIFVLDCSGSMSGSFIQDAKKSLRLMADYLYEGTKFNLYLFGDPSFVKLFETSQPYDSNTRQRLLDAILTIEADMGGTSLFPPINDILKQPVDPKYPRQIFIITDGQIHDRDQLIGLVSKEHQTTRIFTLGIGSGADKELVIGLSNACRGYFQFAENEKAIEKAVINLVSIILDPILSNIQISWGNLPVTQAPSVIRPAFWGERVVIYALFDQPSGFELNGKKLTITIYGNGPNGKEYRFDVPLDFSVYHVTSGVASNSIHSLTAFKRISELEELERKYQQDHKKEIVSYGKEFGLISKHTSYIVTRFNDKEEDNEDVDRHNDFHNTNRLPKERNPQKKADLLHKPDKLPSAAEDEQDSILRNPQYHTPADDEDDNHVEPQVDNSGFFRFFSAGTSTSKLISWSIMVFCIISFILLVN